MTDKQDIPLSLRLSKSLYAELDKFCTKYELKRPDAVRMAVRVFLDNYEQTGTLLPFSEDTVFNVVESISPGRRRSFRRHFTIQRVGNVAAGSPEEGDGEVIEVPCTKQYPKDCYALRVCGHSMSPPIPNEATIIVQKWTPSDLPKLGTIVVYADDRGVALKKLAKKSGKYVLVSTNPDYPDIEPMDGGTITAIYLETLPKK